MRLLFIAIILLLAISIPITSFALTSNDSQYLGTAPINEEEESVIPSYQGEYITTNSSTYHKSNLLDSHNTNKPIKHYEMYSILSDIDDAFQSVILNIHLQLGNLQTSVTNLETISATHDSQLYLLMNNNNTSSSIDIYESVPFKSLMRDVYKPQWIDLYEKEFNIYVSSPANMDIRESMLVGNTTMYDHTKTLFDYQSERLNAAQINYDNIFITYPTYDPTKEDLTQPNSITAPESSRLNWYYNPTISQIKGATIAMAQIQSFNSTIPENLFVKGIGMMEAPWQP